MVEPPLKKMRTQEKAERVKTFRLLDLPPEIWIRICRYATVLESPITINNPSRPDLVREVTKPAAITQVSKVIRGETYPCFFKGNEFVIEDDGAGFLGIRKWRKNLDKTQRTDLRQLYVTSFLGDIEDSLTRCVKGDLNRPWLTHVDNISEGSAEEHFKQTYKITLAVDMVRGDN